jgi:Zn-finger nucleic acid-binding protein
VSLVPQLVSDALIEECRQCGGVWVGAATFDRLIQSRDQQAAVVAQAGSALPVLDSPHPLQAASKVRYVPCPDCRQLMNRKNFAHISGVIIDVCKVHGVWFDQNELGRVIQFVMKGGLDAARRVERDATERQMQRLAAGASGGAVVDDNDGRLLHELVQLFRSWLR